MAFAALEHAFDLPDCLSHKIAALAITFTDLARIASAMRTDLGPRVDILDALPAQDQRGRRISLWWRSGHVSHDTEPATGIGSSMRANRPVAKERSGASSTLATRSRMPRSASFRTR